MRNFYHQFVQISRRKLPLHNAKKRLMTNLLWVSFFLARSNMGAIEFSFVSFILNDFIARWHVFHKKASIACWDLNDFYAWPNNIAPKYAPLRKDFHLPPHQCWSYEPLSSFIFTLPAPSHINVENPARRNARNPSSKLTLMKEGAAKSAKISQLWPILKPKV